MDNRLDDFPTPRFGITAFCEGCGHSGELDRRRLSGRLSVQGLSSQLRCSACGSRDCSIRIGFKLPESGGGADLPA